MWTKVTAAESITTVPGFTIKRCFVPTAQDVAALTLRCPAPWKLFHVEDVKRGIEWFIVYFLCDDKTPTEYELPFMGTFLELKLFETYERFNTNQITVYNVGDNPEDYIIHSHDLSAKEGWLLTLETEGQYMTTTTFNLEEVLNA